MKLSFKDYERLGWENAALSYHKNFCKLTPEIASILVERADVKSQDKLLDVACGPGYAAAYALKKGAQPLGVDFSFAMIQEAKTTHPEIDFQIMDAEELKFSNEFFDNVLINFGILHFANPKKAIEEAFRVLKIKGVFLFTIWGKPTPFDLILESVKEEGGQLIQLPDGPDFFQFTNLNFSKKVLLESGFHSVNIEQIDFIWRIDNTKEFLNSFYESGVRIGGILRAQKQEIIDKIIKNLELKMKVFEKDKKLEIPIPVLLFKARK